jgi:hypothetical protein
MIDVRSECNNREDVINKGKEQILRESEAHGG